MPLFWRQPAINHHQINK